MTASSVRLITPDSLRAGLEEIRGRRRWHWIVFWTYIPAMLLLSLLGEWVFPWAAFAWMGLFVATGIRVTLSRCPRCGERYHWATGWQNPWTRKCMHCGLRLRASDEELVAEAS